MKEKLKAPKIHLLPKALPKPNNGFFDLLHDELIRDILLRLSVKHLAHLKCVSKRWHSFISDRTFVESHLELSPARTRKWLFIQVSRTRIADLDALFLAGGGGVGGGGGERRRDHAAVKKVNPPLQTSPPSELLVLGSCRGLVCLLMDPHFLIIWNPLTGSYKSISYEHIVRDSFGPNLKGRKFPLGGTHLCGFGYNAGKDDYRVVVAWTDNEKDNRFEFFSLNTNSWTKVAVDRRKESSLVFESSRRYRWSIGLFFNGAIHWLSNRRKDSILVFDMIERSFSEIRGPEPVVNMEFYPAHLTVLGGCLVLFSFKHGLTTELWVMREYKVQSSWTLYQIPDNIFQPLCLSCEGDIIGYDTASGFRKYNFRGELLGSYAYHYNAFHHEPKHIVYTESPVPVPNDSKEEESQEDHNPNEA